MAEAEKRQFSPWLLERSISDFLGSKPKSIRSKNQTTFTIEVQNETQSKKIQSLQMLNGKSIELSINKNIQVQKGLVYIYGYDMNNFQDYKSSMMNDLGVMNVEEATWIKPRNKFATALPLSFKESVPNYIDIPGEQAKTKVFLYKDKPQIC